MDNKFRTWFGFISWCISSKRSRTLWLTGQKSHTLWLTGQKSRTLWLSGQSGREWTNNSHQYHYYYYYYGCCVDRKSLFPLDSSSYGCRRVDGIFEFSIHLVPCSRGWWMDRKHFLILVPWFHFWVAKPWMVVSSVTWFLLPTYVPTYLPTYLPTNQKPTGPFHLLTDNPTASPYQCSLRVFEFYQEPLVVASHLMFRKKEFWEPWFIYIYQKPILWQFWEPWLWILRIALITFEGLFIFWKLCNISIFLKKNIVSIFFLNTFFNILISNSVEKKFICRYCNDVAKTV